MMDSTLYSILVHPGSIPSTPSIESSNCCLGISLPHSRPIPPTSLSHSQ